MPPEKEKEYIKKEITALQAVLGNEYYPKGWYYGRLSSNSKALIFDVYKEMGLKLLWESDSYAEKVDPLIFRFTLANQIIPQQ